MKLHPIHQTDSFIS